VTSSGPARPGRYERLSSSLIRSRLFAVSYAPLAAMFALQSETWPPRIAWGVVSFWGLVDGYRLTYGQRRKGEHVVALASIRDRGGDVSGYLATYLLPFIGEPPDEWPKVLVYVTYFAVALVVYVRSDLVMINPTLYLLGWRVVEGKRPTGESVLLLCRQTPSDDEPFKAVGFLNALVRVGDAK
jgi:hypothetical protein